MTTKESRYLLMNNWKETMILIPALNPPVNLPDYIKSLLEVGFSHILVVDDGSSEKYRFTFKNIESLPNCHILTHAKNLGKGRALKNGINYYLTLSDSIHVSNGIVCVDSDGQHTVQDVIKMAQLLTEHPNTLILGVRNFHQKQATNDTNIPWKSYMGNRITSTIFQLLFGKKISDTQTGLRGLSPGVLSEFIDLNGERFEYETGMLIHAVKNDIPIVELPIDTIYINDNSESHFHPVLDSYKIYLLMFSVFFKYMLASLSSFIIDIILFQIFIFIFKSANDALCITISTIIARICSSLYNYGVNKSLVFQNNSKTSSTLIRYYILCIVQTAASTGLVLLFYRLLHLPETIIKIIVDTFLFLISFQIQQYWVFSTKKKDM